MKSFLLCLAALAATSGVMAAEKKSKAVELEPVSVSANRITQLDTQTPFAAEIHTQPGIEKSGASTLYDYLARFSSLTVQPSYGNTYTQLLDMRGFGIENGNQNIAITINGRRMNNIDGTPQLLSSIPLTSIERIEIIKGSGSVAQGDGAVAGTINIITRNITGASVRVTAGSHGHSSSSVSAGIANEYVALQVLTESDRNDGLRYVDINGNDDESDADNFSASLEVYPTENLELRLSKDRTWIDTRYGGPLTKAQFENNPKQNGGKVYNQQKINSDVNRVGLTYKFANHFTFNADYSEENKDSIFPGWPYSYDYQAVDYSLQYQRGNLSLITGVQLFDGTLDDGTNNISKNNSGYFINGQYQLNNTIFSAGWRTEDVDYQHRSSSASIKDSHSLSAWDIGINQQLSEQLSAFININKAFQAPDVNRFFKTDYDSTTWEAIGTSFNQFIKPTEALTYNIGFNHLTEINKLKLALFYSDLKNEIFLNPITYANTNLDKTHKYGLEVQDHLQLTTNLQARASYNWTGASIDEEDTNNGAYNGKSLPGVSEHSITLGLDYQAFNGGRFSVVQNWRSEAYAFNDFANNFTQKQKAVLTTDIGYSHQLGQFNLYTQINNIFDRSHGLWVQDDAIYPVNFERNWLVGVRASF